MAAKSNLKNMVLCLFGTCLFCSAILGGVYAITYDPIEQTKAKTLENAIGQVLLRNADNTGLKEGTALLLDEKGKAKADTLNLDGKSYEYYTQVADDAPVAYAIKSTVVGFGGPLTLMVGVSADARLVINTSVLSHTETPGLGAKCTTDQKFMAQWSGLDLSTTKLEVQKPVKDGIDAITASTITSKAYTLAVANAVKVVSEIAGQAGNDVQAGNDETVISSEAEKSEIVEQEVEND